MLKDLPAERAVLAGICKYGYKGYVNTIDVINPTCFSLELNQIIFKCLEHVLQNNTTITSVDIPSLLSSAKSLGLINIINNQDDKTHIRSIFNLPINEDTVRKLAIKLRKLQVARDLIENLDDAKKNLLLVTGDEPLNKILSVAEDKILQFSLALGNGENDPKKMGNSIDKYIDNIINNPNKSVGIPSGFSIYDSSIGGGFRRGTVSIIGARMKNGKSVMALNISYNVAKLGIPVLYIDTEMTINDHNARLLAMVSDVKISDIEQGKIAQNDYIRSKVEQQIGHIKNLPLHYQSVAGLDFDEIVAIARRWIYKEVGFEHGKTKPCLIVYDYLKLMSDDNLTKNLAEHQALGFQTTALHNFMVKHDVPCVTFVQLNRDALTREDTGVVMGSDRILMFGSNFSILKRKSEEEIAETGYQYGNHKLVPLISRHGPSLDDGDYINLLFKRDKAKMIEGKTRNYLCQQKDVGNDVAGIDDGQISI